MFKLSNRLSSKKKMEEKGDSTGHTMSLKLSNRLSSKKKKKMEEKGDSTGHIMSPKLSNRLSSKMKIKKKKMEEKGDSTGHTMSPKLSNRLSKMKMKKKKKKKKPPGDNGRAEVEFKLGLGTYWTSPLEPATMLDISTWSLENQAPLIPEYLPHAFLRRLWLLSPEARSPCCQPPDALASPPGEEMNYELGQDSKCAVNPLDLVTAVYMSANSFLQQEMTVRMVQCQFAVPLVLPAIIPEQSCFLLWPLRGVVSQWRPHSLAKTKGVLEGDLASTEMPMISCVKLGHCGVSKSRVLSRVIGGPRSHNESFLHRGMDGGQLHRKLSNGLVELGWSLPSGDPDRDIFPVPVVISNLRGDAAAHERCLKLLCRASSAVVVFCGVLRENEKHLLASWKDMASRLILIDLSDPVEEENKRRVVGFVPQNLGEDIGLPNSAVLSGGAVSEEELADRLRKTLNDLLPDRLRYVTLEAAADIAAEVGMCMDEGAVCRKAMAAVEEVLKGLEHGSAQFREKQLPLQGALWSRLAELDKEESKQIRSGEGVNMQLRIEKRRIIHDQSSYRMTTAMKVFTDALFTTDKMERTFFLNWMKLRLRARQLRQCTLQKPTHDQQQEPVGLSQEETGEVTNEIDDGPEDVAYGANYDPGDDDDSFCTDSTVEGEKWKLDQYETQPLDTHYGENNGLQLGFSEQEPEQELIQAPVVELYMAGDPTENDGLELSCPEEQSEKDKLDSAHTDVRQMDLDPSDTAEKIMEEGSSEREVNENGTQSLNIDDTEKINDEWELSYSEGQNKKQEQEPNLSQTEQVEKRQLEPVHADAEQVYLELKESSEQNMEPVLTDEEVIEPSPEPLCMGYTENSGLHLDISEQQSEQQLNLGPVVELHMAGDPAEMYGLESRFSEEQTEKKKVETNLDQIEQNEKGQLDSLHTEEQVELDLNESAEQNMKPLVEEEAIEPSPEPLNMDYTENSGLHFDISEQQSEQELHVAGGPAENDGLESNYSEEQTENQELETNMDQTGQIEKEQLDPVLSDEEQVDLDLEESTEQSLEEGTTEKAATEYGTQTLTLDYTENSGLIFDLPEQQSERGLSLEPVMEIHMSGDPTVNDEQESSYSEEQTEKKSLETNLNQTEQIEKGQLDSVHADEKQVDLDLGESTEQNMEPGLAEEEVIEPGPEPLKMEVTENSGLHVDMFEQQSEQGLKVEPVVELHVTMDATIKDDLESKCTEEQTEKQQLDLNIDQIDQNEKQLLDPVLADAEQVDLALEESAEKDTEPELAEKEFVEPQPFNMDHIENSGSEQKCEQTLNLETVLELHVVGDLTKNDGLETSYPEEQTENQELDPNMYQIDETEKEQLDSVHADTEQEDLDLEESTEENMEEGTTEKAAIENETQTLNMGYTENSGLHFDLPKQQSERGLSLEPVMELHMARDPTVNDEQESSCSDEQTEKKKVETNLDQIAQTEKKQLNPEEPMNLNLGESAEQDTELELTEKEVIEPGPQLLNIDHTENSGLHFALSEQQSEQGLNLDPVEDMHIAGNSTLNDYGQELNSSEKQTKKQELESNLDKIDQSEKEQLDSVVADGEQVDLNLSDEEYAEQNMEKGSAEKEATENGTQLDPVIESGQLDSFHADEEQVDLDLRESAEQTMEPGLAEKYAIEPLNMEVTENNGLHFDLSKQQFEQWLKQEPIEEMHNAGNFTLNYYGQELNSSEKQTEKQELESNMDQIEQSEKGHLDPVLPDAEQVDLDLSDETYAEQNMPEKETFEFGLYETLNEEQNLELKNPENELTDMKPGFKNELKPALEEQMNLEPTVKNNMGLEPIMIVQHAEIDQFENRDSFDEQTIDPEISEKQSLHLESGATQIFDLNPHEEPSSNPTAENHLNLNTSLEDQVELDTFVEHCFEPDPSSLGLEHFLREMGLIFELTHMGLGSGSHNVLRLPNLAVDLLLYGIPLELMDGDASNIPSSWLGHVLAELKRRLPPIGIKVRVLTNLGVHCARNAEVFSALFGVDFPRGRRRFTRGVYMLPLWLPDELRMDMDCDLLIMVDVEGLCSPGLDKKGDTLVHDNEMATIATGLSDVLMHNITSHGCAEFESNQTVIVNALLRTEICGYTPICELLTQDKGLSAKLQAFQLGCVAEILQTKIEETENTEKPLVMAKSSIPCLIGPWQNTSLSEPVDKEYSKTVIELKQNLFEALTKCASKSEATGLPEFMGRLFAVWEAVKAESFSIGLQNTEVAKAFSMLCTELSNWEKMFLEHMESWFAGATKRVIFNNAKALETGVTGDLLSVLKQEARIEVKTEVGQIRSKLEAYLIKDDLHKTYIATYRPNLMSNMNKLQDQVTEEMIEKLEAARENHNFSVRLEIFQSLLEKGQEAKLHTLTETSKLTNIFLEDMQLEEEFEGVWNIALFNFDFRLTKIDDIPARVTEILRENLISRGLQKHMKKLRDIGKNNTSGFIVHDEHFEFHSRLNHIRKQQWLQAHYVVNYIIEEYNQFVVEKSNLVADVSDSYITEVFENVEEILKENPLENTSTFEVDLKVYLCSFACQDFQEIHERYTKDSLLAHIKGAKNSYLGGFIYQVRKRDQCQKVARAFTSMVFKPTALDYIYRPLGRRIVEEMVCRDDAQHYLSPQAFNHSLLEELMEEDSFESFLEYLLSYESFSLGRIQKWVVAHLSETTILEEWIQQRQEEIVEKMNAAVSQTEEDVCGVLSDTKLLLEKVCLNLEKDGDVSVSRDSLDGPLFSITTEWGRFVTCLLEALDEMQLTLAQEFSQNVDITQLLQALPIKPQDCLFNRVRGCDKKCPFCRTPCEVGEIDHEVHRALLHRPKGMLSYTCHDSSSLSHNSCPFDIAQDNLFLNRDTEGQSLAYRDYHSLYPDWSISPEEPDSQTPNAYWRFVLVRFNGRFAGEYNCEPAQLPEEWEMITQEEALESLNQAFHTDHC